MASKQGQWPHLQPGELTLLDYSTDDPRDVVTLSDKEALVLQLANQIQEQQLEKAMLEQGKSNYSTCPTIVVTILDKFILTPFFFISFN